MATLQKYVRAAAISENVDAHLLQILYGGTHALIFAVLALRAAGIGRVCKKILAI